MKTDEIVLRIDIAAPPDRVFRALASDEICKWWVREGVFDTREWTGEVRVGGRWRATGVGRGQPYALEGEFLEVDPPRKLVHTWTRAGSVEPPSTVSYLLEPIAGGTRLTLKHAGLPAGDPARNVGIGWETSFGALARLLGAISAR